MHVITLIDSEVKKKKQQQQKQNKTKKKKKKNPENSQIQRTELKSQYEGNKLKRILSTRVLCL